MHRYPTRFQSKKNAPPLTDMATAWQTTLLDELLPIRLEEAIHNQVKMHESGSFVLDTEPMIEAYYILDAIERMRTHHVHTSIKDYLHHALMYRLRANIDLFTYIKHNHTLFEQCRHLSSAVRSYYWRAIKYAEQLHQQWKEGVYSSYREQIIQYHTLVETWKQVIHETTIQFIFKNILRY